jgi:hypothetical protein
LRVRGQLTWDLMWFPAAEDVASLAPTLTVVNARNVRVLTDIWIY